MSWNETPPSRQPVTARARPAAAEPGFGPADFFVLRTPLLPFDELLAWSEGEDRRLLRARLQALVARPEVREALLVASPSLDESIPVWLASPDTERGRKVEHTLVRYFARMAGRPTPFGLFAGCSFGRLGAETRLAVAARARYGRHTRLDMDYLSSLGEALCRHEGVRPHLTVRPSSSLYLAGGRMRYAEARLDGRTRSYHLVAIELTDYLESTLARAANGARPSELARALVDLGAATREAGEREEARSVLSRGLELATECGATALAERARSELLAAGARPRRTAVTGVEALTPSERRVAEMAAGGLVNREIAQALFVTEKTVETHLGKAYSKLKVRSRKELPEELGDPALS